MESQEIREQKLKYAIALLLLTACKTLSINVQGYTIWETPTPQTDSCCKALTPPEEQDTGFRCPDDPPPQCSERCLSGSLHAQNCCLRPLYACPDDETVSPDCAEW